MTAPAVPRPATAGLLASAATARAAQSVIAAAAMRDATTVWKLLDKNRLAETFPGWLRAMMLLTRTYHAQSSAAAGLAYRQMRARATQSPAPSSLIKAAELPNDEWLTKAYGFSGPGMLNKDTARPNTALSTTLGTTSRIVLDGGRTTTAQTVQSDPVAVGWYFHTDGEPCHWCALIASRGIVFKKQSFDKSDAKFIGDGTAKVHNMCSCVLAPAFSRDQELPPINHAADAVYAESTAGLSGDARLAAFRKAWTAHQSA